MIDFFQKQHPSFFLNYLKCNDCVDLNTIALGSTTKFSFCYIFLLHIFVSNKYTYCLQTSLSCSSTVFNKMYILHKKNSIILIGNSISQVFLSLTKYFEGIQLFLSGFSASSFWSTYTFLYINLSHVNDNIGRRIICVVENRISGENN